METTVKISKTKSILSIVLFFISIQSKAGNVSSILNGASKDIHVSLYIIGSVLGFGITVFLINKIAARSEKNDAKNNRSSTHIISHRLKHHQRVIKKSA